MSIFVHTNCKLFVAQYDFSGQMNKIAIDYSADAPDATTFGQTSHVRAAGGLKTWAASHEGLWEGGTDAGNIDDALFSLMGLNDKLMTLGPTDGADGSPALFGLTVESDYSPGATIGDLFAFNVSAESSNTLVNGTIMHNAARTVSGNGTARQLGLVTASKKLYMGLHVVSASGSSPTLDVLIQSDALEGFASPTTRGTFTQAGAITSQWLTPVAGAIADDDWWRVNYTIGGGGPSFTFIVSIGIQ